MRRMIGMGVSRHLAGQLDDRFDMFIIVQTQFHISLNNRELEFHGFEPLTVRLPVLKNLYL